MTRLEMVLSAVSAGLFILLGLFGNYLRAYTKAKGGNLATKEDLAAITDKVERVRAAIADESALLQKRREVYERIANSLRIFVQGHGNSPERRQEFHAAYSACWLWAPDTVLESLNKFIRMQRANAAEGGTYPQTELHNQYAEIMLRMRKNVGFPESVVKEGDYQFVKFEDDLSP
jgi:hypothetical protein